MADKTPFVVSTPYSSDSNRGYTVPFNRKSGLKLEIAPVRKDDFPSQLRTKEGYKGRQSTQHRTE